MKWDDIRIILAVARTGSLAAAGRRLGVSQTTAARRLEGLEAAIGDRLFTRDRGVLKLSQLGEEVVARAEIAEARMLDVEHLLSGARPGVLSTVRLTAVEGLIASYLVPRLHLLEATHPDLVLELIGDSSNFSLTRRDADMALRLARPTVGHLVVRRLADLGYAVYGAAGAPVPNQPADLRAADWIAFDDALGDLPEMRWLHRLNARPPRLRVRNAHSLMAAVRCGLGLGIMPCYAGDSDPALVRVSGPEPVLRRELWLLLHPELRDTARVRAVCDWLDACIAQDGALLCGHRMAPGAPMC